MYLGSTLDIESHAVVGGKLSVFYGLAVARAAQFGGSITCTEGTEVGPQPGRNPATKGNHRLVVFDSRNEGLKMG